MRTRIARHDPRYVSSRRVRVRAVEPGEIQGVVTDVAGSVLPGVRVTLAGPEQRSTVDGCARRVRVSKAAQRPVRAAIRIGRIQSAGDARGRLHTR